MALVLYEQNKTRNIAKFATFFGRSCETNHVKFVMFIVHELCNTN